MATRRERVELDLIDNFTAPMARAAAATTLLDKELNHLGGTSRSTSKDVDKTKDSTERLRQSTRKSGADVDKYSGRLRLLGEAATILGPAIIPLATGSIPALTASIAGLGAGAAGLGVAIAALQGLGDGIKALDAYQLAPTVENLAKLRDVEASLGPAGTEFLHYIDSLEPQLKALQNTARAGFLPGLQEGIDDLLTRLPDVRDLVGSVSNELGTLSEDAGKSLASDRFTPFFDYIKADAAPTLDAFARSAGNVALGLANLLTAFAPASRDFTSGLEDMTRRFAAWSSTLDSNQGFQDFLSYVRREGPQVVALMGGLVDALVGLGKAAAPVGDVVLPAMTALLKVFGAIAGSPIGTSLYGAVAATLALGRASTFAGKAAGLAQKSQAAFWRTAAGQNKLQVAAGIGLLATSLTDYDDKLGVANTAQDALIGGLVGGPAGLGIGAAVGLYQDLSKSTDTYKKSVMDANAAIASGNMDQLSASLADVDAQITKINNESKGRGLVSNALSRLPGGQIFDIPQLKADYAKLTGVEDDLTKTHGALVSAIANGVPQVQVFGTTLGQTAVEAQRLSSAMAELNGWFSKRDAVLAYKDAIDQLGKGLKNGFTREDAKNLNQVGQSVLQVAQQIKDPGRQANFISKASAQLEALSSGAGPKAQHAIEQVVNKLNDLSGTRSQPKIDADTKAAQSAIHSVQTLLGTVDHKTATAAVHAQTDQAQAAINSVRSLLGALDGDVATTTVRTVHVTTNVGVTGNPQARGGAATGGYITGPGTATSDSIPAYLSNGEYVVRAAAVAKYGTHMFDRLNAMHFADGGSVQNGGRTTFLFSDVQQLIRQQHLGDLPLIKALSQLDKTLTKQVGIQQKSLDKAQSAAAAAHSNLDTATGNRDSLTSTISGTSGLSDIFALSSASSNPFAAGASGGGTLTATGVTARLNAITATQNQFLTDIKTLQADGVSGAALQAIIGEGAAVTHSLASGSAADLSAFSQAYGAASSAIGAVSSYGGNAVYGDQVAAAQAIADRADARVVTLTDEVRKLRQDVRAADKANTSAHDAAAEKVGDKVNGAASGGRNRGQHQQRRATQRVKR